MPSPSPSPSRRKRSAALARAGLAPTEQVHPRSEDLELRSARELVRRLHAEDRRAARAVGRVEERIAAAAELVAAALRERGRLLYVGAGTSGRLGALDAAECPPTFGTSPRVVQAILAGGRAALSRAVEGAEDDREAGAAAIRARRVGRVDVVCGISASSSTPFVRGALEEAKARGARTILLCANPRTPDGADVVIALDTGPELISGSTRLKAGTATKMVLSTLSSTAMVLSGHVFRGRMVDLRPTNAKLRGRAVRVLGELTSATPAEAQALLTEAGDHVRVALVMHWTGLPVAKARRLAARRTLRELEPSAGAGAGAKRPVGETRAAKGTKSRQARGR